LKYAKPQKDTNVILDQPIIVAHRDPPAFPAFFTSIITRLLCDFKTFSQQKGQISSIFLIDFEF
jgi:hypothetical protein